MTKKVIEVKDIIRIAELQLGLSQQRISKNVSC